MKSGVEYSFLFGATSLYVTDLLARTICISEEKTFFEFVVTVPEILDFLDMKRKNIKKGELQ
ncbi:hypothetical protein ACT7DL_19575 [Bacillus paranthracis]